MDKHYFLELLNKYLDGKATKVELHFILSYYNLFESEPEVLELLTREEKNDLKETIHQGIWDRIDHAEITTGKAVRSRVWRIGVAAAAAATLLLFAFRYLYLDAAPPKARSVANLNLIRNSNHVISLPDGSTVTLSAGSKLNYPASFNCGAREVYLEGQAYFDVRHDSDHPFVVHAGKVNVTVLGTAFNVKAFSDDRNITVTVKRGKVRVSDSLSTLGTIRPRQQIVYNKQDQHSVQRVVDTDTCLTWRTLDCLFDDLTITEVATLLEERFKVKISVDARVANVERFTATFPQNETLEQALKSICEFNGASYQYDKDKAMVMINAK